MEDDFDSLNTDNDDFLNDDSEIDLDNIDIKKNKINSSKKKKGGRKPSTKKQIKGKGKGKKKKEELEFTDSDISEEEYMLKDDNEQEENQEEEDDIDNNIDIDDNNLNEYDEDDNEIDDVFDKEDNDNINTLLTDEEDDTKTTLTTGTINTFKLINDAETVKSINPEIIITNQNNFITRPFLTKYEFIRILSERTQQIESGAKIMLKIPTEELLNYEPEELAMLELKYKVCPIKIVRTIGSTTKEIWNVNDLENIWI